MKKFKKSEPLYQKIAGFRWLALAGAIVLVILYLAVIWWVQPLISSMLPYWLSLLIYGVLGGAVLWITLDWLFKKLVLKSQAEAELRQAHQQLAETHRQLLAVHDIGREIASASDMQQILTLATRAPSHLIGAKGATLVSFDSQNNRLNLDMAWGLSDTYLSGLRQRMQAGLSTEQCRHCNPLTARVVDNCPLFEGMESLAEREGIQSLVCLPLEGNHKRNGIINAYFPSPDGPPEEQIQLLNIVATEIASALDGARLRASQMATLYAVEHLSDAQQSLDDLLAQILDTTWSGWGTRSGVILLYNRDDATWHHCTRRNVETDQPHFELAVKLAEYAKTHRHPLLISNLSKSAEWSRPDIDDLHSVAVAPLVVGKGFLGALIMMAARQDLFKPDQSPLFSAIAHQSALAIDNAQLHAEVQQMATLEERYRLSREIHDGLAQTLSVLGWQLDHIKKLQSRGVSDEMDTELTSCQQMVREAYMDVREAIDGLRLQSEQAGSLSAVLQEYVTDFESRTGINTSLEVTVDDAELAPEMALQLQRIIQEALTNIRKHAQAQAVQVDLRRQGDGWLNLTIADDGRGFDPDLPRGRKHLGLSTMRERAESLGGDISIVTGSGQGTRVTVTVPLEGSRVAGEQVAG